MSTLIEKATYKKSMKADCAKWRKFLKKNSITIKSAHDAFESKYPESLSYDGFYKNINMGGFSYSTYVQAKSLFTELEKSVA